MPRPDNDPVTWGDLKRIYKKLQEQLDELRSEAFAAINQGDQTQADFWNEHEEKIARLTRGLNRLKKSLEEE